LLARYLTRPISRLRAAARRLAEGDLDVRVAPQVLGATHEVEALGADLDRMAERISELLASQRRLLQDVSHELRSPLARLHVALGLARRAPGEVHLDRIELEAERLADLIGQLLTLSRLGEALSRVEVVDVGELLGEIVRDADYEARADGRSVSLKVDGEVDVHGNRDVLRWTVENVLRNAVRFAPEQTVVEVRLERRGDDAVVIIRDHGPGVPEAELEAIFRPFYRVGSDRDRKTGGRGLGLAIAERGVFVHGGTIEASNAESGLQVTITLPMIKNGSAPLAEPASSRAGSRGGG
jgi:signal transduction histidine kinase